MLAIHFKVMPIPQWLLSIIKWMPSLLCLSTETWSIVWGIRSIPGEINQWNSRAEWSVILTNAHIPINAISHYLIVSDDNCTIPLPKPLSAYTERRAMAEREGSVDVQRQVTSSLQKISDGMYAKRKVRMRASSIKSCSSFWFSSDPQEVCDRIVDAAVELAHLIKDIWSAIEQYALQQKLWITCLDKPKDGALEILDKMSVTALFMITLGAVQFFYFLFFLNQSLFLSFVAFWGIRIILVN